MQFAFIVRKSFRNSDLGNIECFFAVLHRNRGEKCFFFVLEIFAIVPALPPQNMTAEESTGTPPPPP